MTHHNDQDSTFQTEWREADAPAGFHDPLMLLAEHGFNGMAQRRGDPGGSGDLADRKPRPAARGIPPGHRCRPSSRVQPIRRLAFPR